MYWSQARISDPGIGKSLHKCLCDENLGRPKTAAFMITECNQESDQFHPYFESEIQMESGEGAVTADIGRLR